MCECIIQRYINGIKDFSQYFLISASTFHSLWIQKSAHLVLILFSYSAISFFSPLLFFLSPSLSIELYIEIHKYNCIMNMESLQKFYEIMKILKNSREFSLVAAKQTLIEFHLFVNFIYFPCMHMCMHLLINIQNILSK